MITVEIDEVFVVDENTSDIITIDGGIVEISQGTENKTVVIDESFEQVVDVVTENTVDIFLASKSANDNAVIMPVRSLREFQRTTGKRRRLGKQRSERPGPECLQ